jgi:hypothetical protein
MNLQRDIVSVLEQMNMAQDKPQVGALADAMVSFFTTQSTFIFSWRNAGVNWLRSSEEAEVLENQGLVLYVVAAVMNCPTQL